MEGKPKRPEWEYTTLVGTVDREEEERLIQEEEEAKRKAEEVSQTRPPGFDRLGPTPDIKTGDLSETNPRGPSTHAAHVARGLEEAEARRDRGPEED